METKKKIIIALTVLCLPAAVASVQAELKEVSYRNTKDGSVKLYCQKIAGKIKTTIKCDGRPFTPDADWEEIKAEKVCFRNSEDRIRTCHELGKLDGTKKEYICFNNAN